MKEQQMTGTASIQIIRALDEEGNEIQTPFDEIDEKEFAITNEDEYVEVVDMAFDSRVISSTEYSQFLEFKKQQEASEEGSVSFKLPKRVGWGVVGTMCFFIIQGIVWTTIMYNSQSNFNEKIVERVRELEDEHNALAANTYTKREEDLRYDNLKLEVIKNKELLDIAIKQSERGKDVSK